MAWDPGSEGFCYWWEQAMRPSKGIFALVVRSPRESAKLTPKEMQALQEAIKEKGHA